MVGRRACGSLALAGAARVTMTRREGVNLGRAICDGETPHQQSKEHEEEWSPGC